MGSDVRCDRWRRRGVLRALVALLFGLVSACDSGHGDGFLVFAAASLQGALQDVATAFTEQHPGMTPVFNFAGSNVLARQIEAGAAGDVFVSADQAWMDHLEAQGLLLDGTRRSVVSNRLVVVARRDSPFEMSSISDLPALGLRHLAVGDPEAVPAGRYARRYLEKIRFGNEDLWSWARLRLVPAPDVRAALALVEADPRIVGIVYASDASVSPKVRVLFDVPPEDGPTIRYAAAVLRQTVEPERATLFVRFLASPEATLIFGRYGFAAGGR